ncbi:MAG: hypothetical protein AB7P69_28775 [Candidatus Binatia bacterium]
MGALSDAEWSRVYAFIWNECSKGNSTYRDLFEKNPKKAVTDIDTALRAIDEKLGLTYTTLFNIDDPGLTVPELEDIISGRKVAFLQTRLTC